MWREVCLCRPPTTSTDVGCSRRIAQPARRFHDIVDVSARLFSSRNDGRTRRFAEVENTFALRGFGTMTSSALPDYSEQLSAFHRAFAMELRTIVQNLPLAPTMEVLDVGSGDGFYMALLAERLTAPGRIVGLDKNEAYIAAARERMAAAEVKCEFEFRHSDLKSLSESPPQYDLVWCAQSLYSLAEPVSSLSQMRAAVRPGGFVVVLENDTLHQLSLPWPPKLELALRTAEFQALREESSKPEKFYVGRRLPAVLAAAGLEPLGVKTYCIDRMAPLGDDLEQFVSAYLQDLFERTTRFLDERAIRQIAEYLLPSGDSYLLREPWFALCWTNVVAWARRPVGD